MGDMDGHAGRPQDLGDAIDWLDLEIRGRCTDFEHGYVDIILEALSRDAGVLPSWAVPWNTLPSEARYQALGYRGLLYWYSRRPTWCPDLCLWAGGGHLVSEVNVQGTENHMIARTEA